MIFKGENILSGYEYDKQYVRDQYELSRANRYSEYNFKVSNAFADAIEMPYDGYFHVNTGVSNDYRLMLFDKNGTLILYLPENNNCVARMTGQIFFRKGDYVSVGWNTDNAKPSKPVATEAGLFFYEKRDYTGR